MMTVDILERLLDPLTECLTTEAAQKIVSQRPDAEMQARLDDLAEKANEGTLTDQERAEYEKFRAMFHLVTILQSRARRLLRERPAS